MNHSLKVKKYKELNNMNIKLVETAVTKILSRLEDSKYLGTNHT